MAFHTPGAASSSSTALAPAPSFVWLPAPLDLPPLPPAQLQCLPAAPAVLGLWELLPQLLPVWASMAVRLLVAACWALRMELSLPRTSCFHGWALSPSRDTQSPPGISSVTSHSTRAASPAFREGKAAGGVPQHRTLPTVSHATLSCSSFSDLPPPGSPVSTVMPEFGALLRAPCVYPSGHRLCSWVLHCPSPVRLALSA